jgi:hypothetical protein
MKRSEAGQSMIESCIVILLIGLIFMGIFQISMIFSAREILNHAAARGVRARTVGFNRWMVTKAVRVATIPNAGPIVEPDFVNQDDYLRGEVTGGGPAGRVWERLLRATPTSAQYNLERARIPEYLAAHNRPRADWILNYAHWDSIDWQGDEEQEGAMLNMRAQQSYPLVEHLHRAFYADDRVELQGEKWLENHYPLYLDDEGW